jgi:membrane-associated phospholipid phosphatase
MGLGGLGEIDIASFQSVYCTPNEFLRQTAQAIAWLSGLPGLLVLSAVPALRKQGPMLRALLTIGTTALLVVALKHVTDRDRPFRANLVCPSEERVKSRENRPPTDASFPSGHAAGTACTLCLLWLHSKRKHIPPGRGRQAIELGAATAVLSAVAWSRIYLGAHYPSDILAGSVLGVAVGLSLGRPRNQPCTMHNAH